MTASLLNRQAGCLRLTTARRLSVALCLALLASLALSGEASAGPIVNFSAPTTATLPANPRSVAVGDFNVDGNPDLAITSDASDLVTIRTGSASGTFSAAGTVATPAGTRATVVAVGDFNVDGDPDLAVTNFGGDTVSIMTGGAGTTFSLPSTFSTGSSPVGIAVGDFNGDADPDLAVTNQGGDTVSILLGAAASARFTGPVNFNVGDGPSGVADGPNSVAVGDFNGDADPDLAVTNKDSNRVSILTGGTGGTFSAPTNITVGSFPVSVAAGDFNGDADPDLAVANQSASTVSILVGAAGAGFTSGTTLTGGARAVDVGDFNSDKDPDLVVGSSSGVSVFVGGAGATFGAAQPFAAGGTVESVAVADFNKDAAPDWAVSNYFSPQGVTTALNTTDLTPPDTTILTGPPTPTNDNTPTFTFSSNEAGGSFQCSVDGGAFAACTSPHTTATLGEGSHTWQVRAIDAAGNVDATPASRTFTVDTVAPDTTILTGPPTPTNDNTPTFTFSSNEAGGSFQCSVDGGAFAACTSPHTTATLGEGSHTWQVRAIDAAGNVDATPASRTFTVDTVAPDTTILTGPPTPTNDNTPTFTFSSNEAGGSFQCSVDGGAFAACTSPHTTATLGEGSHTWQVRAIDAAGNVDATPASRTFTVDTVAPDTTILTGPPTPTNDNTPTFTFSSNEAGGSFECRVDAGAFASCTSPQTTAPLTDGAHTFDVRAIDAAGNVDASPATRSLTVDAAPPDTTLTSGPSGPVNDPTPTFAFSSTEAGSTFECRVDTGTFAACTSPHTTAALADGAHTFEVRAVDALGNADPTASSRSLTVDTMPPDTTIVSGPSGEIDDNTPTFAFSSTEAGSTFQCKLDASPFVPCSSPFTLPALTPGPHTFQVRSIDRAGNVDASPSSTLGANAALRTFTVGAAAPGPPILGKRFNIEPISGDVLVSEAQGGAARASATVPGLKGRNFVPLREARQVAVGSILDTRKGTVRLTSARNSKGVTQAGDFKGGVFQVLQSGKSSAKGLTELRLKGASFAACRASSRGKKASAARSRRKIRRLRGSGKGRFSTRGRYSAATVRGTVWTVTDRCDGTLTKVTRGRVAVRDLRKRKTIVLRAGKSYLARAPG